ncbi:MAG TPA: methyl-accepting chemotaxis protein [Spirochaetota bacterium]|nr:methyl-accepting chemotaxis protein [Spirochaetota bacterium]HNT10801.1 methyl-accepting chemotaxis protein [Spirochaetota bacterium]HNV48907.1 methyl-accepting chemotaxis protein [Spirochaetota bacterium]HOS41700.1 methyl-accepting chemotaxis protein [Spirochaetota bacterium]HPU89127.1 methyl-accepting chemotaxis protein [Spirochaetota bacterium]
MNTPHETIARIVETVAAVVDTARDVNRHSHERKDITQRSLAVLEAVIGESGRLKSLYERVCDNLGGAGNANASNAEAFRVDVGYFKEIIRRFNDIKETFSTLRREITKLSRLVSEIQNDTNEIFSLALNASIASSKYSHTSGVFDVLADKLNEMSIFINQNLEGIINVVAPIIDGIEKLVDNNNVMVVEMDRGHRNFLQVPDILDRQRVSIAALLDRAQGSARKIDDQVVMMAELRDKIQRMDEDAGGAITGSANVIATGESLQKKVQEAGRMAETGEPIDGAINHIREQATVISGNATAVNEKSKSQLDFSISAVQFCDSIVAESLELKEIAKTFSAQSDESHRITETISDNLMQFNTQLGQIDAMLVSSNGTIQKFNSDFSQMDSIIGFLKNIMKSMSVIGMLSRIESARDPEEFRGFMTIAENIRKLQEHIHANIPLIEHNIAQTHALIENVNVNFAEISRVFGTITQSSSQIIERLQDINRISAESQGISASIMDVSGGIDGSMGSLRGQLTELSEVVKKPIEGSAANMERGKAIANLCDEVLSVPIG